MSDRKIVFRTGKETKAHWDSEIEKAMGETPQRAKPPEGSKTRKTMSQADFSGYMCGGKVKKMAAGGSVRGCGIAQKGKTKGRMR